MLRYAFALGLALLCLRGGAQPQDFKVIGYLPYYRFGLSSQIDYGKLTHLNLAFGNPDMQGNLSVGGQNIDPIVDAAHDEGVYVYLSLGGGLTADWVTAWTHWQQPENRSFFIHNIVDFVYQHELDGVDMDLEWSNVTPLYSPFVLELHDSLAAHGFPLTAALPGTYRYPNISEEALHIFDFINMMVYDLTGPWAPNNPGQHSPYSFAVSSINYWQNQGVSSEKLTLGVPFYGWNFNNAPASVTSATFGSMVSLDAANAQLDQVGQIYYNGIPTIRAKTELAMERVSGIMIWELGQDAFNEHSLLQVIYQTIYSPTTATEGEVQVALLKAYPSPFSDYLNVSHESEEEAELRLLDMHGRNWYSQTMAPNSRQSIALGHLAAGWYILQYQSPQGVQTIKVLKQ